MSRGKNQKKKRNRSEYMVLRPTVARMNSTITELRKDIRAALMLVQHALDFRPPSDFDSVVNYHSTWTSVALSFLEKYNVAPLETPKCECTDAEYDEYMEAMDRDRDK